MKNGKPDANIGVAAMAAAANIGFSAPAEWDKLCWLKNIFSPFYYYHMQFELNEPASQQAGKSQQKNITSTSVTTCT